MRDAGPGSAMRTSTPGQVSRVRVSEWSPQHALRGLGRMRSTQEASRLLATLRDRSPTVTYALIGSGLYPAARLVEPGDVML